MSAIDEMEILDDLIGQLRARMHTDMTMTLTDWLRLNRELQKALATRARWRRGGKTGTGFKLPGVS